jgi:phosphonate transport system substrate-binding protein
VHRHLLRIAAALGTLVLLTSCGQSPGSSRTAGDGSGATLSVSAIPDQDPQLLQRLYGTVAEYLAKKLGVKVRYVPVTDYTASVTAFRRGDLDLVFFGGLTGVQARLQVPGAQPLAQRDIDATFHSVFIAGASTGIGPIHDVAGLKALAGHTITFGSQTSTSGRLMPQYFLSQAGVRLSAFTGQAGFSGSHDTTIKLVEAGTFQTGALNASVWDERRKDGSVDTRKVKEVFRTPEYHDYHWLIRPDADDRFGKGFTGRVKAALLALDGSDAEERQIMELFEAKKFIPTTPENYTQIEAVGRQIGLIK